MSLPYAEVIGDPIAHSKSPLIHGFWLEKLGIRAEYRKTHVKPDELAAFLAARRADPDWRGCNVTVPHKEAVIPLLDRLDPFAERIGAVNTIVARADALIGHNTDAPGFMEPLLPLLPTDERPRGALMVGAGGAARAIAFALQEAGFNLHLLNRDPKRARLLLEELGTANLPAESSLQLAGADVLRCRSLPAGSTFQLVVNATTLGMTGKPPLAIRLDADPEVVVYDIVYDPLETPLLAAARSNGNRAIDGLQMLVGQAAAAFAFFFGQPAPRAHDAALRAFLTA